MCYVRWICNVRLKDRISSESLLEKLGINDVKTILWYNRLRCFGHVARNESCINNITILELDGHREQGRPRETWKDTIKDDRKNWTLKKGRSCKQNWMEKETQNKHGSCATHSKWNQHVKRMMMMMMMFLNS